MMEASVHTYGGTGEQGAGWLHGVFADDEITRWVTRKRPKVCGAAPISPVQGPRERVRPAKLTCPLLPISPSNPQDASISLGYTNPVGDNIQFSASVAYNKFSDDKKTSNFKQ